jgi:hypothetical protein
VDAKDEPAAGFHERPGFRRFAGCPTALDLSIATALKAMHAARGTP